MPNWKQIEAARTIVMMLKRVNEKIPPLINDLASAEPDDQERGSAGDVEVQYRLMARHFSGEVVDHVNFVSNTDVGFKRIIKRIADEPWMYPNVYQAWIERREVTVTPWETT